VPAGIPNKISFYYEDIDVDGLSSTEKNSQYVFNVLGHQWDPFEQRIVQGGVPIANDSNIDFSRLPEWLSSTKYILEEDYHPKGLARKYTGFWRSGHFFDKGLLTNTNENESDSSPTSFTSCKIKWYNQGAFNHYAERLVFAGGESYSGRVKYIESSMDVIMDGAGIFDVPGSNSTKGYWEEGRIIVNTFEELSSLSISNQFLFQEHRHKLGSPFKININNMARYVGEVYANYTQDEEQKFNIYKHGSGKIQYTDRQIHDDVGEWKNNKILIDSKNRFDKLQPFLKQVNRYELLNPFKIEIDDDDVVQFVGKPKFENGEFIMDGEAKIEYTNGKTDEGMWNNNKIFVGSKSDFDNLQPYLQQKSLRTL